MVPSWIQTYSGKKYDVFNPDPNAIYIEDIAHALSNLCRYNGHTPGFYSVAEHSILVSEIFQDGRKMALYALLHDAAEAYIGDYCHPIKQHLKNINELEDHNLKVIFGVFGLEYPAPDEIELADRAITVLEYESLMYRGLKWELEKKCHNNPYVPFARILGINGYSPKEAKMKFLQRFEELYRP